MTQEEKIKDLEERIAYMDADNSALAVDLAQSKKVAAGLKGRNKQLAQDVERWKAYGKEADELNEKRIGKIEEQEKVIEGLEQQVLNLSRELSEKNTEISVLRIEVKRQSETIAHITRKPWYKRVFSKSK